MDNNKSFRDKLGREIQISEEYNGIVAIHNKKQIGSIEVECDDICRIYHMNVDESYRRAGIATAMMELVAELYGPDIGRPSFNAIGGSSATCCSEYFTNEGASLIRSCIEKSILNDTETSDPYDDDWDT